MTLLTDSLVVARAMQAGTLTRAELSTLSKGGVTPEQWAAQVPALAGLGPLTEERVQHCQESAAFILAFLEAKPGWAGNYQQLRGPLYGEPPVGRAFELPLAAVIRARACLSTEFQQLASAVDERPLPSSELLMAIRELAFQRGPEGDQFRIATAEALAQA